MATPEGKVKTFIDQYMKANFPGAWRYCPPGVGFFGSNGQPDRLWFWNGVFIAIEAKAEGGKPTDLQIKRLKEIQANGGIAAIVVGKDRARMDLIKKLVIARYIKIAKVISDKEGGEC